MFRKLLSRLFSLIRRIIPLTVVVLAVVFVLMPMTRKIQTLKLELAEEQARVGSTEKPASSVITLELIPRHLAEQIYLPGMARPWKSLVVVSQVQGKIVEKKADSGTRVQKGDVLAVIDTRDYALALESATASYDMAQTTWKRLEALSGPQFVTKAQLDEAAAALRTSRSAMENARLVLSRCTLTAPFHGILDRSHIEVGSFLSIGDPVALIVQIDPVKVEVGIPESDVPAVRTITTMDMVIDALDGRKVTGHSHYLHHTTDSLARLYTLEIRVANPHYEILPDMFARVTLVKNEDPEGLAIPMYAMVTRDGRTGVYVADQGIARFRAVETGFQDGWKLQVVSGLVPGDAVVVVGHRFIEDGDAIAVTRSVRTMEELTP